MTEFDRPDNIPTWELTPMQPYAREVPKRESTESSSGRARRIARKIIGIYYWWLQEEPGAWRQRKEK